ncbi:hypothetical protein BKA65DRAFT_230094 [Rhexocercosporidium sp. MPI-PUGE-AT-0058]|nr:hypothetical protein BKA65DRAFT_230094 [Rhexocercosporidium sp. MPI-PUGE-AT-0058]
MAIGEAMGRGAADIMLKQTVKIGRIKGGLKVNMIPDICVFEADIRMPIGLVQGEVMEVINPILKDFPGAEVEIQQAASNPAAGSAHDHPMIDILARQAERVTGRKLVVIPSSGGMDCKLWRYEGVEAYVLGVSPEGLGS